MVELEADLGRMDKVEAEADDLSDALQVGIENDPGVREGLTLPNLA